LRFSRDSSEILAHLGHVRLKLGITFGDAGAFESPEDLAWQQPFRQYAIQQVVAQRAQRTQRTQRTQKTQRTRYLGMPRGRRYTGLLSREPLRYDES
jgi:hypothetical protein